MRDVENGLGPDLHANDGDPYAGRDHGAGTGPGPGSGLLGAFGQVPSQGEIGSLIALTVAANLALAHRQLAHRQLAHRPGGPRPLVRHGDGTTERRSN